MTRTRYYTATSIDGFIADADNRLDWLFEIDFPDEAHSFRTFFSDIGAMAMGATTYEFIATDHPDSWVKSYGDTPAWVFTHRSLPTIPGADVSFVQGDVAPVHRAMVAAAGGRDVWLVGGGELVGQFADQGLLDEITLNVAPVALGGGAPLLPRRLTSRALRLVSAAPNGPFADLTYQVTRP